MPDKEKLGLQEGETDDAEQEEGDVLINAKEPASSYPSPFDGAFFFSKYVSFWWMNSLFKLGYHKTLEENDIAQPARADTAEALCERIESRWTREAFDEDGKVRPNASLMKVLIRAFGPQYSLLAISAVVTEALKIAQPVFLGFLVNYFSNRSTKSTNDAYLYATGLVICAMFTSLFMLPFIFIRQKIGMQVRVGLTAMVYKKVLNLSYASMATTTTGHIVNLVASDAQKLDFAAIFLHYLWLGPIELVVITYLLWQQIGPSCLAGIGLLLLLAPVQMLMGKLLMKFRRKIMIYTDDRVKVMNEVISGIKVIKLYTWEKSFKQIISRLRTNEIKAIRNLSYLRAVFMSFFFSSASLISFVTFMTYVLTGNSLTPEKVFTCLSLFNVSRMTMTLYFPIGITLMNEGRVSVERLQKLLMMEDIDGSANPQSKLRPRPSECGVDVDNVTASWSEDAITLQDVSFKVNDADLVAIIGQVGAGKSSILMTILNELPPSKGKVTVKGKVSYASQESWIFNGTVKYNITLGQEFNQEKYDRVIYVCALEKDLELLEDGDLTLVGERGVSLSGGQKARVNLARAVYCDADIYIFDDPLSAVDAHVGRHLFDECIQGYLAKKPRILVTHQVQYLTDADSIVALSQGKCIGQGTFHELTEMGLDFMEIVDEEDSGLGSDDDPQTNAEMRKRRFSQQMSCVPAAQATTSGTYSRLESKILLRQTSRKGRAASFARQESFVIQESAVSRSEFGIAHEATIVNTFQETDLPKEKQVEGAVGWRTYKEYFKAGYGLFIWSATMLLFAVCQATYLVADWWLSHWSNKEHLYNTSNNTYPERTHALIIYGGLVGALLILGLSRAFVFFKVILRSSEKMHGRMFDSILRAPLRFFDTNSIGRILNRFSKDLSLVDDMLSFTFFNLLETFAAVLGVLILVGANIPVIFAVIVPLVIIFYFVRRYFITTARDVKRIEGLVRSPVFGHFSTTLLGLPTIRAFRAQGLFTDIFYKNQDTHTGAWFCFIGCASWLAFIMEIMTLSFLAFATYMSLVLSSSLNPGMLGLILSYSISLAGILQQCVRQSTDTENQMVSVERTLEYCDLPSEAPAESNVKPPSNWPRRGSIAFGDMSFAYADGLPNVLHEITADIHMNEKIGVCGRTGAGKSSLLSTLFRTSEPTGRISIDGVDIKQLGLYDLRSKISIIPQEPVIFSGTMRKNLDPFDEFKDDELWTVLDEVEMRNVVDELPLKLESQMAESGGNLSVGQRQLVCLARAILRHNKVLVIDEATANVDPRTDAFIQQTIREKFKDCTVLTIAHRLNTIMDSDRIMVLDAGRLKEFDEPYLLLRCRNTILYSLVAQTGGAEAQHLFDMARKKYYNRRKQEEPEIGANESELGAYDDIQPIDLGANAIPMKEEKEEENNKKADDESKQALEKDETDDTEVDHDEDTGRDDIPLVSVQPPIHDVDVGETKI